ncbi:MAG TPA: hypothetical protein VFA85_11575 [Terriglobales bacterium]|nr:hypothetical protein [Terriglobales bacterium]
MKRRAISFSKLLFFTIFLAATSVAAEEPKSNPERTHAFELYQQGKMVEAMPLLEQLAADNPKDIAVVESWGVSILSYSQTVTDPVLRQKARARARSILVEAAALGDKSDLCETLLRMIPEDGTFPTYSDKKDVDSAMQQAESDFARGDIEKARQGYLRAYLLDSKQYYAALFIGDTYFKQQQPVYAGQWFANAIQINPDVETAYRYWGDALLAHGDLEKARGKYIDAIVADPYNRTSWNGLNNWLTRTKLKLNWIRLKDRVAVELKDGKTNVTLDSSLAQNDSVLMASWLAYGMSRASWARDRFAKEYPSEPSYRHSLKEETESLHILLEIATRNAAKDKVDLAATDLGGLVQVDKAGFLEPFVLLNRADNGIARDYESYRAANREKIRQYMSQFVVPQTPPQTTAN